MYSWGEDGQGGFLVKDNSGASHDGDHFVKLNFHIQDLSAGYNVLAVLKSDGNAFIIRTNESNDGRRMRGKQKFVKHKEKIQAVSCGDDMITLLTHTGKVLCVGPVHTSPIPRTPEALCNIAVSQVACGSQHSVALSKDGQVYTWGQDSRGQLGLGNIKLDGNSPQHVRSLSSIPLVQIAAGGEQSFALSVSGGVFSWGRNDCGQLGLGDTTDRHTPTVVYYLDMKKTTYISCGKDHTAILTKDGVVFTFGSGQYGQLGHNSFSNELRPRIVTELWGAKVIKIACGRHHTLVMTDSKKVYSCGCGEQGQLGHGEESHPSVPLPVQLTQDVADVPQIQNIYAGGNCSFAISSTNKQDVHKGSDGDSMNKVQHCLDGFIDRWTAEHDSKSWKKVKQEIKRTFSSASCLNQSFLDQRNDKHFQTSRKFSGLNLSVARLAFKKLVKKEGVWEKVEAAVTQLIPSLNEKPVGMEGLRIYLLLLELLHVVQKNKHQESTNLTKAVAASIVRLSAGSLQIIVDWWCSLLSTTKIKHVKVWKHVLTPILSSYPVPCDSGVKDLLLVLQHLYNANKRTEGCKRIPDETFSMGINQVLLQKQLEYWCSVSKTKGASQAFILSSFPFVMDVKSKIIAFDTDATWTKGQHQQLVWTIFGWTAQANPRFFELKLQRASLMEDTFKQLAAFDSTALKKPFVVYFDGDPKVTAVYKRDFFYHFFNNMVSTKSGMFMFNDSNTLAWFPSKATKEDETNFFLFGRLCGLALYNQSIIHLRFPLVLFKKLLDVEPSLEDMLEFSPRVGKSLQDILDYEDDVIENLYLDFLIDWNGTKVDLDPHNPNKPLTGQNKKEFVDAYVGHVFNKSVEGVFQEFRRGFFEVCDRRMVKLFRPEELQGLLVGQDVYDWGKMKQNTVYELGYDPGHPTIRMFWEVFDELTEELKKDFLWFLTGFRRAPILGMTDVRMRIRMKEVLDTPSDQLFPESLTCHSILELPSYSTKEVMREKLTEALVTERGFTDLSQKH